MKEYFKSTLSLLAADRALLALCLATFVVGIVATIYVVATLEVSELRIITHYSAFGVQHFYRDQWSYLAAFALYNLIATIFGIAIALKFAHQDRLQIAKFILAFTIGLIILAIVIFRHLIYFI